eukprot:10064206-Prorocentrum_lima.AAC.1
MKTSKENKVEKPRRAMGRNIKVVTGNASPDTLVLPGVLHGPPVALIVFQVWNAYAGRNSHGKRGYLSAQ